MDEDWPAESWRRRMVIVMSHAHLDALEYEKGGGKVLLNDEVHVVAFPPPHSSAILQNLGPNFVREGVVLVQSPYDEDRYEPLDQAVRLFALEKCMAVFQVCQLLGARKISVSHDYRVTSKSDKKAYGSASATVKGVRAKGRGSYESGVELREEMLVRLTDTLAGGKADVAAAEELLRAKTLTHDVEMRSLVDFRRYQGNPGTSREIDVEFEREWKQRREMLASLDVDFLKAVVPASLKAGYDREFGELTRCRFRLRVDF